VWSTHLGLTTRCLLLSDSSRFVDVWRLLWREDGSVVDSCRWSSPAQSFSCPSLAGLITFYCLRFETLPTWRARSPYLYPPGTGWPDYIPMHWVPFSFLHMTRRATVEVLDPASTRGIHAYNSLARTTVENTVSNSSPIVACWFVAVETLLKSFPWEHALFCKARYPITAVVFCLSPGHCLVTALHGTI
jgi:hypothetical protein